MKEDLIRRFQRALGQWCWDHDFAEFCAATGLAGDDAAAKWRSLQLLQRSLAEFDAATLARILRS